MVSLNDNLTFIVFYASKMSSLNNEKTISISYILCSKKIVN